MRIKHGRRPLLITLLAAGLAVGTAATASAQGTAMVTGDTVAVKGTYTESAPVASGPVSGGGGGAGGGGGGGEVPALPGAGAGGGAGGPAPKPIVPSADNDIPELAGTCGLVRGTDQACGAVTESEPAAAAPAAPAPPPIDWISVARDIANDAAASIDIEAIDIGIVPEDIEGNVGLVGMPTWMWVENPSPETIGPMQKVVTSGPVVVTLNAVMHAVNWDMGDGAHVLCPGALAPYTPYTDVAGDAPSPTCGHRYNRSSLTEPGKKFEVTATSAWQVTWSATTPAGATGGVIPMARSSSTNIAVGENQVLVLPGGPGA